MDFALTEEQEALRDLAAEILRDGSSKERLDELDADGSWFDATLWQQLVDAGIVGIAVPEAHGGGGFGFVELHQVLVEVGRNVAHVPLWETLVLGAWTVSRFGTDAQQAEFLPGVASGDLHLTAALVTDGRGDVLEPSTTARTIDGTLRLDGVHTRVPNARLAHRILVPARTDDNRVIVVLVDPTADGVSLDDQETISRRPHATLTLTNVAVSDDQVLGGLDDARDVLRSMVLHAQSGLASMQVGVTATALAMTAEYASHREQFGRKIGSFQAVGQRMADAFIDSEGVRLTALQAAWRLSNDLDARSAVDIAKWWAAEGAHRVVHAAQHVHGGVGIDYDYPLHRFFTAAKEIEFSLGHATATLRSLGQRLAHEPV